MSVSGRKDFDVKQILRIRWRWFGHATSPPPGARQPLLEELLSKTGDRHHQHQHPLGISPSASAHVNTPVCENRNKLSASACPSLPPFLSHRSTSQQECGSAAFTIPSHSRSASDVTREGTELRSVVGASQDNGSAGEDEANNNTTDTNGARTNNNNNAESESSSCRLVLSSVSDYFAAMFTSDVREAKQEEVKMEGVDPDALWVLVQYAYTDFTSDFVEVVALGRGLDLGMLYDCRSDTFSPDSILWEKNLISTMKLSIPRPQSDVRVLDGDTLQDRLTALDLSVSLRASVVSGLVETTGASAFVHHPVQTELQDRVTLHCRTSTRLEMLSHELLQGRFPLPVTDLTTSTHVVVAVLYGTQAFFVFNSTKYENMDLKDLIKKTNTSSIKMDLLPRLIEKEKPTSFIDGNSLQSLVNGNPQNVKEVPLKVWLYPLKKFDQTLACALKDIRQDQLCKAENILEKLRTNISFSQYLMRLDGVHDVFTQFPALKDALLEFSLLLQHYQSNFMSRLASCIKNIRDTGSEVDEDNLQDLLKDNDQLPVELQCMHQWLQNKSAQVRALIQCRSANISILNNQNDLQNFVQDCQADKIVCFIFTSLEGEDPFLSALKRITESVNIQEEMKVSDTSQKSLWNLQSFILKKDTNESREETIFIAASVSDFLFPGSTIHLYQAGKLISRNVKLDTKPDPPEIIKVQQTRVMIKLQSLNPQTESYRVEYRAVREDKSPANIKWEVVSCAIDSCEISALAPGSNYQLRYAVMDSNEMTDYSRVLEIQTASRDRPGAPTVLKLNNDSLYIAWERPETDEDSRVVYYIVEYLEAGLEGWQSFQSDGPVCECRITLPYSTCYKARVSAVYINGDVSPPSKETKISARGARKRTKKKKNLRQVQRYIKFITTGPVQELTSGAGRSSVCVKFGHAGTSEKSRVHLEVQ
ncbi:Stonustoxin subunit alpha [Bagarius yarrelli]|uniref:Stonustoxin subunit alpha n=1 Tax=Bagarius yarrelli TaxID=175774 RepID=A0A556U8E9_BAGYA|nr:Stonustoxin subunit alpha [Bagarius yarrelli]